MLLHSEVLCSALCSFVSWSNWGCFLKGFIVLLIFLSIWQHNRILPFSPAVPEGPVFAFWLTELHFQSYIISQPSFAYHYWPLAKDLHWKNQSLSQSYDDDLFLGVSSLAWKILVDLGRVILGKGRAWEREGVLWGWCVISHDDISRSKVRSSHYCELSQNK